MAVAAAVLVAPGAQAIAQTVPPTSSSTSTSTSSTSTSTSSTSTSTSTSTTAPAETSTTTSTLPGETTTTAAPTAEGPPPSISEQDKQNASAFDGLTVEEYALLQRYLDTQTKVSQAQQELVRLNDQLQNLNNDLAKAINKVREANERFLDTKKRLEDAEAQLESHRQRLRNAAVEAYMGGGKGMSSAAVLLKAGTVDDLTKSKVYANSVADDERDLIDRFVTLRDQVSTLKAQAESERAVATAARDEVGDRQDALRKQAQLQKMAAASQQQALTDQVQVMLLINLKRGDYLARIAAQGRTSDSVEGILKKAEAGQPAPLATIGIFTNPVPGARLTSTYGPRVSPLYGASSNHPGIDLAISQGTPIAAPADGVVLMSEYYGGYGNCTIIDHGNSIGTLYGHQVTSLVRPGDIVTKGQIIGLVGTTGYSTGPHLHWEVRIQGVTIDPIPTLGAPP